MRRERDAVGMGDTKIAGTSERVLSSSVTKTFAQLTMLTYWTLDGIRSTFHVEIRMATYPGAPGHYQPPILGHGGPFYFDLMVLSILTVVFLTLAFVSLRAILAGRVVPIVQQLTFGIRHICCFRIVMQCVEKIEYPLTVILAERTVA